MNKPKTPIPILSPDAALEAFDRLIGAWKDYKITAEIEATKRENIRAWRDANVKAIEKNTEILKAYLEQAFAERRHTINQLFQRLDSGIEAGNPELVSLAMTAIISVTQESPLKGAQQLIAGMYDPDVKQLEI